jgi:hypothetical protein
VITTIGRTNDCVETHQLERGQRFIHVMVSTVRWVPCHHGMARPQVVDEEMPSSFGRKLQIY